ncbi:MAG: oligosaccharide repeat unit polymerase [Oscillospiraceae bacterium]|jgi:oligosaccharide repeat unit polymerase|nr:oligosaccharide repeat unit polymerase [Oscillospiraceae bacterium]
MLLCYLIFGKDIMAPPFIMCAAFIFSVLCCMYNIDYWKVSLSWKTYGVIVGGISVFIFVSGFVRALFPVPVVRRNEKTAPDSTDEPVYVKRGAVIAFLILSFVVTALYLGEVMRIALSYGGGATWASRMYAYRKAYSYGILNMDESIPMGIRLAYNFVLTGGYVCVYLFMHELVYKKKINKLLSVALIAVLLASLVNANRRLLLAYPIIGLVIYYVLWHRKHGWHRMMSGRFALRGALLLMTFSALFVAFRATVGRNTEYSPVYYVTFYAGASVQNLDLFLQNPPPDSSLWGKETFSVLYNNIGQLFDIPALRYVQQLEPRVSNGVSTGNVYTGFRDYLYDFGLPGFIVLTSIMSAVMMIFYLSVKSKRSGYKHERPDFSLLVYAYAAQGVFLHFFNEKFYTFISISSLRDVVFLYVITLGFCARGTKAKKTRNARRRFAYSRRFIKG